MAAIGSVSYGQGVEYYTRGGQREYTSYYTGQNHSGEPAGTWSGAGAARMGLVGKVDAKTMENLYSKGIGPDGKPFGPGLRNYKTVEEVTREKLLAEPDALPERVREIQREAARSHRQSNTFADFTFSLSKDITVQHTAAGYAENQARLAGDQLAEAEHRAVREVLEEAGHAGNRAALDYLNQSAGYSRTGRHGKGVTGRWIEAQDWTVATFFQHTSRALDPQLHWHNPILLNTVCADGKVRKLDTALIQQSKGAAAAHGARVAQELITEKLGWTFRMRTDGNGQELTNVDQKVKEFFSERKTNITKGVQPAVDEFVATHGREPSRLEFDKIQRRVSMQTRPGKANEGEARAVMEDRWDQALREELGAGLARQAAKSTVRPAPVVEDFSPQDVIKRAIARCQESQSTWTRAELTRHVEAALPGYLGVGPHLALKLIEGLVDEALGETQQITNTKKYKLPSDLKLDNGASAYQRPGATRFASKDHIASEFALADAAIVRGRESVSAQAVDGWLARHKAMGLKPDQAAAIRGICTSGAAVSVLVGPAGAGKTYVVGGLKEAWAELSTGRLVGLATSEQATDVLRGEGVQAKNVAQWLAAQRRIEQAGQVQGLSHSTQRVKKVRPEDEEWEVKPGDLIVPDEASMADTDKLEEIRRYVEKAGARLLLTGDPKQLSAVGAGGAMDLVVKTDGADVYELTEVRRFNNSWEGQASLDLREGKLDCLDQYAMHDRIRDGGTIEQCMETAAGMYVNHRLAGDSAVVVTPTNETAAATNGMIRDRLVEAGLVEHSGVLLERDRNIAGVGDVVKCRKNDWDIQVKNQGRYIVEEIWADGTLDLAEEGTGRSVRVSPEYVKEWVELGYAGTVHAVQGSTVDFGIPIIREGQPLESVYPATTRGREGNIALVETVKQFQDPRTGKMREHEIRLDAAGVFANCMEVENQAAKAALTLAREDAERSGSLRAVAELYEEAMRELCRSRTSTWMDRLLVDGHLSEEQRQLLAADKGTEQLGRLLRTVEQAGHDPRVALEEAVAGRTLDGSRSPAQVLHFRVTEAYKGRLELDPDTSVLPPADAPADYQDHFEELSDMLREKRSELGLQLTQEPPVWAVESLGPVPEDMFERATWEERAGIIAAHREASGWSDEVEPLGPAPGMGKTEARAAWAAAWTAAGRPESTAEEHELSEGALRNRVRAMQREDASLPPSVYEEMRATERALYEAQQAQDEVMVARLQAKREGLQEVEDERRRLKLEAAITRDLGYRARAELEEVRKVRVDNEDDRVTAAEWLEAHQVAMEREDPYRDVTEHDIEQPVTMDVDDNRLDTNTVHHDQATWSVPEDESTLPSGVPSDFDVETAVLKARVAANVAADRASAEEARTVSERQDRAVEVEASAQDRVAAQDFADA